MATRAREVTFAVGQVVKLKSGGPDMTVRQAYPASAVSGTTTATYNCQWFAGKKLENGTFPPDSLVLVQAESTQ
jgi:uncharacterized protein YodC (DUF2158 family)